MDTKSEFSAVVSVIVPVFNVEQYLTRCVLSILHQDFQNFELILIDDGSSDDSGNICDDFSGSASRVRTFHSENKGVAASRNLGIEVARGEYIAFVDADDYVSSDYLSSLIELAETHDAELVQCSYVDCSDNQVANFGAREHASNMVAELDRDDALKLCVNYKMDMVLWGKLYKRELFNDVSFPVGYTHEDTAILPILVSNSKKIVLSNLCVYAYVHRPDSIMSAKIGLARLDIFSAYHSLIEYFSESHEIEVIDIIKYHSFIDYCTISELLSNSRINREISARLHTSKRHLIAVLLVSRITWKQKIKALFIYLFPKVALSIIRKKQTYGLS